MCLLRGGGPGRRNATCPGGEMQCVCSLTKNNILKEVTSVLSAQLETIGELLLKDVQEVPLRFAKSQLSMNYFLPRIPVKNNFHED